VDSRKVRRIGAAAAILPALDHLILEFDKSVFEFDACVAAVAKRHVVRGPTTAKRNTISHFVGCAVLRLDSYASANP